MKILKATSHVGRFAPSPTGRMHLGNICTALLSWLSAKSKGGRWILRIEDLDPQRSRTEYARLLEDDLMWLGLHWDEGGLDDIGGAAPYRQSLRHNIYLNALNYLRASGLTYRCRCTRSDIMATQAPHQSDGRIVYSSKCRPKSLLPFYDTPRSFSDSFSSETTYPYPADSQTGSIRLAVPDMDINFNDLICGDRSVNLARHCGDFVLQRADGAWAYMLAVVVDDALMGVTEVVRGNDLLLSAAQQIYIYRLLGFEPPQYAHVPLLCNAEGQRLSKRDSSLNMESLRKNFSSEEIIGRLAYLTGLRPDATPCSPADLLPDFSMAMVTKSPSITV